MRWLLLLVCRVWPVKSAWTREESTCNRISRRNVWGQRLWKWALKDGYAFHMRDKEENILQALHNLSKGIEWDNHSQDGEYQRTPKQPRLYLCESGFSHFPTLTGSGKDRDYTRHLHGQGRPGGSHSAGLTQEPFWKRKLSRKSQNLKSMIRSTFQVEGTT